MDSIVNMYASASGLWKKIAVVMPYVVGLGTLLAGLSGLCLEFGHAANAAAMLTIAQGLQHDPNVALCAAGLAALGIHEQHKTVTAAIVDSNSVPLPNAPGAPKA
jgi:hypothetical protein